MRDIRKRRQKVLNWRAKRIEKATKNKRGTQSIANERDKAKTRGRGTKKLKNVTDG
jgi:hypothetical protein